jgi:hypothetical protein
MTVAKEAPERALQANVAIRARSTKELTTAESEAARQYGAKRESGLDAVGRRQDALTQGEETKRADWATKMHSIFEQA